MVGPYMVPDAKQVWVGLQYIRGIGAPSAKKLCHDIGVCETVRGSKLTEEQITKIYGYIRENYCVDSELRTKEFSDINRLKKMRCYRGIRHAKGLIRIYGRNRNRRKVGR